MSNVAVLNQLAIAIAALEFIADHSEDESMSQVAEDALKDMGVR